MTQESEWKHKQEAEGMTVSLADFMDLTTLPKKQNNFQAVTKQVRFLDSILSTLNKGTENIKEELETPSFGIQTSHLEEELRNVKEEVIDECINKIKQDLLSIYVNNNLLTKTGMLMKDFDARTYINYMKKQYSDIDYITLSQWQYAIIEEMVPARLNGGEYLDWKKRMVEHIKDIDSAGIELYFRGRYFTDDELLNIIVKFSKFVAGNYTKIPEIEGFPLELKEMEAGKAYKTEEFKSLRYFNGDRHILKIGFKNADQRALFKEMLFTPAYKLLSREETEAPELKDACDICLFKEVSCFDCNDYDHWVGSCSFCQKNTPYPRYKTGECDLCKTGRRDNFIPVIAVQKVSGLYQEDGYCVHHWKARKFRKNPILKVHCWGWGVKGALYKHYTKISYPIRTCISCHNCVTEKQEEYINNICKSEKSVLHKDIIYIYNYKK